MMEEFTMANDDKWPNLEKKMDHQMEIEDDLDSEIHAMMSDQRYEEIVETTAPEYREPSDGSDDDDDLELEGQVRPRHISFNISNRERNHDATSPTSSSTESDEKVQNKTIITAAAAPLIRAPTFATALDLDDSATNLEEDVVGDVILKRPATPFSSSVHENGTLANSDRRRDELTTHSATVTAQKLDQNEIITHTVPVPAPTFVAAPLPDEYSATKQLKKNGDKVIFDRPAALSSSSSVHEDGALADRRIHTRSFTTYLNSEQRLDETTSNSTESAAAQKDHNEIVSVNFKQPTTPNLPVQEKEYPKDDVRTGR